MWEKNKVLLPDHYSSHNYKIPGSDDQGFGIVESSFRGWVWICVFACLFLGVLFVCFSVSRTERFIKPLCLSCTVGTSCLTTLFNNSVFHPEKRLSSEEHCLYCSVPFDASPRPTLGQGQQPALCEREWSKFSVQHETFHISRSLE